MSIEEDHMALSIRSCQDQGLIGYIHVGETNRRIPIGENGNINWPAFSEAIKASGYLGPLVLEPLELDTIPAASKLCIWRRFTDPEDIDAMTVKAGQGIQFLRGL